MELFFSKIRINRSKEEALYNECHRTLYFTSLRILNNSMDAEEVMHDTIIKYLRRDEEIENRQEREAWMKRVCINLSIDRLRKNRSFSNMIDKIEKSDDTVDGIPIYEDDFNYKGITVGIVKQSMSNLPDGYRLVLSLHLFEGYDYEEIAQIMGVKEVSVRTQYIRGKAKLIEEIKNQTKVNYYGEVERIY